MKFNALIPELSVTNIESTKQFYIYLLGFKLEYERINEKFMFEEIHSDGWNMASLEYPLGRGINFSIACGDIEQVKIRQKIATIKLPPIRYRNFMEAHQQVAHKLISMQDFNSVVS